MQKSTPSKSQHLAKVDTYQKLTHSKSWHLAIFHTLNGSLYLAIVDTYQKCTVSRTFNKCRVKTFTCDERYSSILCGTYTTNNTKLSMPSALDRQRDMQYHTCETHTKSLEKVGVSATGLSIELYCLCREEAYGQNSQNRLISLSNTVLW